MIFNRVEYIHELVQQTYDLKYFSLVVLLCYCNLSYCQQQVQLCSDVELLCSADALDGYSATMFSTQTDGPNPLCQNSPNIGGISSNLSWFGFVASSTTISATISLQNCTEVDNTNGGSVSGIQFGLYDDCDYSNSIFCEPNCTSGDSNGDVIFNLGDLAIGEDYFFFINGCFGSICDYTITINLDGSEGLCNTDCTLGDIEEWNPETCECIIIMVVVYGCTNPNAVNYNPLANCDDGSCIDDQYCPNLDLYTGDDCNDGDSSTYGDMVNVNCECTGSKDCSDFPIPSFFTIDTIVAQGEEVCLDIMVKDYFQVESWNYVISFDPTVLDYYQFIDNDMLDQPILFNASNTVVDFGLIYFFYSSFAAKETLPDSTALFTLCFDVIGEPGDKTDIVMIFANNTSIDIDYAGGCLASPKSASIGSIKVACEELFIQSKTCNSNTNAGTIEFSFCGNQGPYYWNLSGNGISLTGTLDEQEYDIVENLSPGQYLIEFESILGTKGSETFTIEDKPPIEIELVEFSPPLCASLFGIIEIDVANQGNVPFGYEYQWSNFQYTPRVQQLPIGSYTVTVTDHNNCSAVETYIFDAEPIQITEVSIIPDTCDTQSGKLSFNVTGGTPFENDGYYVRLEFLQFGLDSSFDIQNLEKGNYSLRVTDSFDCVFDTLITIPSINIPIHLSLDVQHITCDELSSGSIYLDAIDSTEISIIHIESQLIPNNIIISEEEGTFMATDLLSGQYLLSLVDKLTGCTLDTIVDVLGYLTLQCDDSNPCTMNDIETSSQFDGTICIICEGELVDCDNGTVIVQPCDDGDSSTDNDGETILECNGSVCIPCSGNVYFDCLELMSDIGDNCDDLDDCTFDDMITIDCECVGSPMVVYTYFYDIDQDGFGDSDNSLIICQDSPPEGTVLDNSDCNDNDPNIFPGADELVNNGIDEDCDGMDLTSSTIVVAKESIRFWPNPTQGILHIENLNKNDQIYLYDIYGQLLQAIEIVDALEDLDLTGFNDGIYFISVNHSLTKRIIKIH